MQCTFTQTNESWTTIVNCQKWWFDSSIISNLKKLSNKRVAMALNCFDVFFKNTKIWNFSALAPLLTFFEIFRVLRGVNFRFEYHLSSSACVHFEYASQIPCSRCNLGQINVILKAYAKFWQNTSDWKISQFDWIVSVSLTVISTK